MQEIFIHISCTKFFKKYIEIDDFLKTRKYRLSFIHIIILYIKWLIINYLQINAK